VRIWRGYGSEHSMNLVMIGEFKSDGEASDAKALLDTLAAAVEAEVSANRIVLGEVAERFGEALAAVLRDERVFDLRPAEIEQFAYDISVSNQGTKVIVRTDESDVSAFLKVLIEKGAKVEVFSGHHYPETDE
jgi:hypothetical protein